MMDGIEAIVPLTFVFTGDYADGVFAQWFNPCDDRRAFFQLVAHIRPVVRLEGKNHLSVSGDSGGAKQ